MNRKFMIILLVISMMSMSFAALADYEDDDYEDYEYEESYDDSEEDEQDSEIEEDEETNVNNTYDEDTPEPRRTRKPSYTPYAKIVQTTIPMTPKPTYPPAVSRSPTPKPTKTPDPNETPKATKEPKKVPYMSIFSHPQFMWGITETEFCPDMFVSKADLAVVFSYILADEYDAQIEYKLYYEDVDMNNPFANYIAFIDRYDILKPESEKKFEMNKWITRAELAEILSEFTDKKGESSFIDVSSGHKSKKAINSVVAEGWMSADKKTGKFNPDRAVTRAELAMTLVLMLDRDYEETLRIGNLPSFEDVTPEHWAYPYIMDAVIERQI